MFKHDWRIQSEVLSSLKCLLLWSKVFCVLLHSALPPITSGFAALSLEGFQNIHRDAAGSCMNLCSLLPAEQPSSQTFVLPVEKRSLSSFSEVLTDLRAQVVQKPIAHECFQKLFVCQRKRKKGDFFLGSFLS